MGQVLIYFIPSVARKISWIIAFVKKDKKNAGPPEWRSRERWKAPILGTGAQATGSFTSGLTINLSRESGRYSPTKGFFIDIMPKVGIEPTIP
jgi:hypothetical protein